MARGREYQLSLPEFGYPSELLISQEQKGDPPLILSQSRLELIASCMSDPSKVERVQHGNDPEFNFRIIFGIAFHKLVQALDAWRVVERSIEYEDRDYVDSYYHKLYEVLPRVMPTSGREAKVFIDLLNDERLILPRKGLSGRFLNEQRTIYEIIASKVTNYVENSQDMIREEAMRGFDMTGPNGMQILFPSSRENRRLWLQRGGGDMLRSASDTWLHEHLSNTINPHDFGPGYNSEVRLSAYLNGHHIIWSTRIDSLVRIFKLLSKDVRVIDYKSGNLSLSKADTYEGAARLISVFVNGLMAYHSPKKIKPDGKAVKVKNPIREIGPFDKVRYSYVGLKDNGLDIARVDNDFGWMWSGEGFYRMKNLLDQMTMAIYENRGNISPLLATQNRLPKDKKMWF